jgi:lipoyl-dependent peroxiredoxin
VETLNGATGRVAPFGGLHLEKQETNRDKELDMADVLYGATSTAWGGRDGHVASEDGRVDLHLSIPKSLGGDDGPGTNPEELFATGYAACFHSALKLVASQRKLNVDGSAVSVTISLVGSPATGLDLAARIEAEIPTLSHTDAVELVEAAHAVCPYSRATKGNISVEVVAVES